MHGHDFHPDNLQKFIISSTTTTKSFNRSFNPQSFNFKGVPVRVDAVTIDGLNRTKDDYIQKHLRDLFNFTTFEDVSTLINFHLT